MIEINGLVEELDFDEFIIIGTNENGNHLGGAARQAYDKFGAIWGESRGILGKNSYGIVTLDKNMNKLSISEIKEQIPHLIHVANNNLDRKFYLTDVGCGIANFKISEIAPLFNKLPGNIIKVGWR